MTTGPITANLSAGHILNSGRAGGAGTHEASQSTGNPNGAGSGTHAIAQAPGMPSGGGAGTFAACQGT